MTIKSLTITEDAYDALKTLKCGDESFSKVILRLSKEKVGAAAKFFGILKCSPKEHEELLARVRKNREELNADFEERKKRLSSRS